MLFRRCESVDSGTCIKSLERTVTIVPQECQECAVLCKSQLLYCFLSYVLTARIVIVEGQFDRPEEQKGF